jgi:hypothetical protein
LAVVSSPTPKPTRVLVIFSFYFYILACFHLDRVPVPSFIFPLNACLCVRVCHTDNSDLFHFRIATIKQPGLIFWHAFRMSSNHWEAETER